MRAKSICSAIAALSVSLSTLVIAPLGVSQENGFNQMDYTFISGKDRDYKHAEFSIPQGMKEYSHDLKFSEPFDWGYVGNAIYDDDRDYREILEKREDSPKPLKRVSYSDALESVDLTCKDRGNGKKFKLENAKDKDRFFDKDGELVATGVPGESEMLFFTKDGDPIDLKDIEHYSSDYVQLNPTKEEDNAKYTNSSGMEREYHPIYLAVQSERIEAKISDGKRENVKTYHTYLGLPSYEDLARFGMTYEGIDKNLPFFFQSQVSSDMSVNGRPMFVDDVRHLYEDLETPDLPKYPEIVKGWTYPEYGEVGGATYNVNGEEITIQGSTERSRNSSITGFHDTNKKAVESFYSSDEVKDGDFVERPIYVRAWYMYSCGDEDPNLPEEKETDDVGNEDKETTTGDEGTEEPEETTTGDEVENETTQPSPTDTQEEQEEKTKEETSKESQIDKPSQTSQVIVERDIQDLVDKQEGDVDAESAEMPQQSKSEGDIKNTNTTSTENHQKDDQEEKVKEDERPHQEISTTQRKDIKAPKVSTQSTIDKTEPLPNEKDKSSQLPSRNSVNIQDIKDQDQIPSMQRDTVRTEGDEILYSNDAPIIPPETAVLQGSQGSTAGSEIASYTQHQGSQNAIYAPKTGVVVDTSGKVQRSILDNIKIYLRNIFL